MSIGKGKSNVVDEALRRAQWRQEHGLHGQQDPRKLRERCTIKYATQGDLLEREDNTQLLTA